MDIFKIPNHIQAVERHVSRFCLRQRDMLLQNNEEMESLHAKFCLAVKEGNMIPRKILFNYIKLL